MPGILEIKYKLIDWVKATVPFSLRYKLRAFRRRVVYAMYLAKTKAESNVDEVTCPVSGNSFPKFLPEASGKRLLSPDSGLLGRHRVVWLYLVREEKILDKEIAVLHIAPEPFIMEKLQARENIDYVAGDKMVFGYRNQPNVQALDLTQLKLANNSFDLLICNHVLEHIPNDAAAIREMYRVVKPGGKALVTVPLQLSQARTFEDSSITGFKERAKAFGQWDHVRAYGTDIVERFESVGFTVELNQYGKQLPKTDQRLYGLNGTVLVLATKPS